MLYPFHAPDGRPCGGTSRFFRLLPALLISAVLFGCTVSRSPITGNKRAYGYSWEEEVQIGREADPQIRAQYGVYDDPQLHSFVDSLGQALVEVSHVRRPEAEAAWKATEFHFAILDSPVINAFALPGGYVYLTRGLMAHLEDEAQLAVVLGHEIGHVAGRHASKQAAKQLGGSLLLLGAAVGGQILGGGNTAENILNLGGTATQLLFLSYGRDDESESDRLGVEYSAMLGFDSRRGSEFFNTLNRMGERSGQTLPTFLSTHPDPGAREERILELAADYAADYDMTTVAREHYLSKIDGMTFGEDPRNGFVREGRFYHPDLAFEFPVPPGYNVINQAQQVVLLAGDEQAVIQMTIDAEHQTAAAASDAFAAQEGLQIVERGMGSANGLPARYVVVDAQTETGGVIRVRAHFIDYGGRVYFFLGMADRDTFANYDPQFQLVMRGFSRVTNQSILAVQPDRLDVSRTNTNTPFQALLPGSLPQSLTPIEMAILNQVQLDTVLRGGSLYKLVR